MKKTTALLLTAFAFSCSKKDALSPAATLNYQLRVAAVENSGALSYSPTSKVKSGKVAVEFETGDVSDIKAYNVEVSTDGVHFQTVKTIAADQHSPNRLYTETVVLP